jgi:hypothetical protein
MIKRDKETKDVREKMQQNKENLDLYVDKELQKEM